MAARAADAADVDGAPVAYVVAMPGAPAIGQASRGRGIHKLTPDGTVTAMAV